MTTRITISLTQEEVDRLQRVIRGQGGFQSLLERLQPKLQNNNLELDLDDVERIARNVKEYGEAVFKVDWKGFLTRFEI